MFPLPSERARADCPSEARGGLLGGRDGREAGLTHADGVTGRGGLRDEESGAIRTGVRRGLVVTVEGGTKFVPTAGGFHRRMAEGEAGDAVQGVGDAVRDVLAEAAVSHAQVGELARPARVGGKHLDLAEAMEERRVAGRDGVIEPVFLADGKVVTFGRYDEGADGVRIAEAFQRGAQEAFGARGVRVSLAGSSPGSVGGEGELRFREPREVAQVAVEGGLVAVRDGEQTGAVLAGETSPE